MGRGPRRFFTGVGTPAFPPLAPLTSLARLGALAPFLARSSGGRRQIRPVPTSSARAPAPAAPAAAAPLIGASRADHLLEVEERVARRLLLRFLLVAAVPPSQDLLAHDHLDREHLLVVGADLARDPVLGMGL